MRTTLTPGTYKPVRLYHSGVGAYFIVDGDAVYADHDGDGRIAKSDRYDGPLHDGMLTAARHFAEYYVTAYPGAKCPDPAITSAGCLNTREAAAFAASTKGVAARRPDLLGHLDFFDRRDGDGMISLGENYRGWRDLGFRPLKALALTIGSAVVFGRLGAGLAIDVEEISEKRPRGSTGIYGPDGNVNQARLAEFAAIFDEGATPGVLTHEQCRAALARLVELGTVPRRQFESLFALTGRLNGSNTVTRAQFIALFDNSLFWTAASLSDSSGQRRL